MRYKKQECVGARLRRLSRIVDGYYRKCLVDFNITENQMTVLFVLSVSGKIEQGKIGEKLKLGRSTVSRAVRLLEKQNLIERTAAYRPEVELTKQGEKLVKKLNPVWEEVMDELTAKLGDNGMQIIGELESKLNPSG